jgi:fibronectin type 3 domain-containing protein
VALAWSAALGCNGGAVSGYHVYRRSSRESGYRRLTESAVATAAFTDPTAALQASAALADAHAYTYAVSAVDADGDEGALSAPVTVSLSSPDAGSPPPASAGGGCFIAAAEENPCSQWLEALIGWAMMAAAGLMRFGRRYR